MVWSPTAAAYTHAETVQIYRRSPVDGLTMAVWKITYRPTLLQCFDLQYKRSNNSALCRSCEAVQFIHYLIAICLLSHALSLPKVSPLTRSLQFISVTVALESFLLSWPIQECQLKWEGIKVIASHCAWIITGCGGHSTFRRVCRHQFDFAVSCDGVWLEFDAVLSLCDSPPQQMTPDCSRWTLCVALSTCVHLITVSLMVLHLALRHLLQHSSQRHPLSFQMFTCPSKQTQTFGSFLLLCHLTERDRKGDKSRWEEKKWRVRGVLKSATLHFVSEMAHLAPL